MNFTCHIRCRVMMRRGSSPCCTYLAEFLVDGLALWRLWVGGPMMLELNRKKRQAGKVSWMIVGFWKHVSNPIPLDLVSQWFHMTTISKKHVQQMWGSRFFWGPQLFVLCFGSVTAQLTMVITMLRPWSNICNAVFTRFARLPYFLAQSFTSTTSMAWGQKMMATENTSFGAPKR